MRITFPDIEGSGEIQLDVLKAICGGMEGKSMVDLASGEAHNTRKLPFAQKVYVDKVNRDIQEANDNLVVADIFDFMATAPKYDVSICMDAIEHFIDNKAMNLVAEMERISDKQIIFTPIGEYMIDDKPDLNNPDTHKSAWLPEDFEAMGWATVVFPNFHPTYGDNGLGEFFAWHCSDIESDFKRVKSLISNLETRQKFIQMNKIEQIKQAIDDAKNNKSKLQGSVLELQGFTSYKIKHLMNNLGAISKSYLEVGIHKASMFVSTLYQNNCTGIGIDNWSQFEENGFSKKMAYHNCDEYLGAEQYKTIEGDCFSISDAQLSTIAKLISNNTQQFDMYTYDAEHGYDNTKKGIGHFLKHMANEFILIIDDASWESVITGTKDGIKENNLEILFEQTLWDGKEGGEFHNGIGVFLLKK